MLGARAPQHRRQTVLAVRELEVVVVVREAQAARSQLLADAVEPIGETVPRSFSRSRLLVHPGTDQRAAAELPPGLDRLIEARLERVEVDVRRGHDQTRAVRARDAPPPAGWPNKLQKPSTAG